MQLRSDDEGRNRLHDTVMEYYEAQNRDVVLYKETETGLDKWRYLSFIVDKKRVIRYAIGNDQNPQGDRWVGGVALGIGPDFFNPGMFWSFENFQRFKQSADTDSVVFNLALMDEYWGLSKR